MDRLSPAEIQALQIALDDEPHAWGPDDQVITGFGAFLPYFNVRDAEARHVQPLSELFAWYGLPIPASTWPGRVLRYASVQDACVAAVVAEIANGEMYERLIGATQRRDILTVLGHLQQASQQRHLQVIQRCAGGCGAGRRRQGGRA